MLRLAAALLLLAFTLAPAATAGWSVPEGRPYDAEETIIAEVPSLHALAVDAGRVAWIEEYGHNGQHGRGRLRLLGSDLAIADAEHPTFGADHLVWRDHSRAGTSAVNDGTLAGVLTLATGRVERLGDEDRIITPPRIEGTTLVWASVDLFPELTRQLVRVDLAAGITQREELPVPCSVDDAWPAGDAVVLSSYDCNGDGTGGLWVVHGNGTVTRHAERPIQTVVDGRIVVFTEYRAGEGRGTNLYVLDLDTLATRRVTYSEGREAFPTLSGHRVAWADTRSEARQGVEYTMYFGDLHTRNEYLLSGSRAFTAGGVLDGRDLYYGDAAGRIVRARLPAEDELLRAEVEVAVDEAGASLDLTLVADDAATVAWDTDLDGVFETNGVLQVPIVDDAPQIAAVQGAVVDTSGRVTVMNVDVRERWTIAKLGGLLSRDRGEPELPPSPTGTTPSVAGEEPDVPPVVTQEGRGTPIAPWLGALAVLVGAALRRPRNRRGA